MVESDATIGQQQVRLLLVRVTKQLFVWVLTYLVFRTISQCDGYDSPAKWSPPGYGGKGSSCNTEARLDTGLDLRSIGVGFVVVGVIIRAQ